MQKNYPGRFNLVWSTQVMNGSGNAQEFKADISQKRRRYLLWLQKQQKKLLQTAG